MKFGRNAILILVFILIFQIQIFSGEKLEVILPQLTTEENPTDGLVRDILTVVWQEVEGEEVKFSYKPMPRIKYEILEGDALIGSGSPWSYSQDEKKNIDIIVLFNTRYTVFYLKDKFPDGIVFDKPSDLVGHKIGILRGTITEKKRKESDLGYEVSNSIESLFLKLLADRVDMVFMLEFSGLAYLKKAMPNDVDKIGVSDSTIAEVPISVIVSKVHSDYSKNIGKLRKGLSIIKKNGKFDKITAKYQ